MGILDNDEHGEPAGDNALDPTHLTALAVRFTVLAGDIRLLREEGKRRDDKIDGVQEGLDSAQVKLEKIDREVEELVRKQITDEDVVTLRALIKTSSFRKDAWIIARRWGGYGSAVALATYALREPIRAFLSALGKALS